MYTHAARLSTLALLALTGCSSHDAVPRRAVFDETSRLATGARIYNGNCIACHQQSARGIPGVYPSLVGSPVVLGEPRELASWVIQARRPAAMPTGRYSTVMPMFGWLKADDAAALFTYLRSQFGNSASAVDAAAVAQALAQ